MKSINHAIHGLVSSLLLNLGLTRLAEKFDPMLQQSGRTQADSRSTAFCELPCSFAPKSTAFCELPCSFTPESAIRGLLKLKTSAFCELPCSFAPESAIRRVLNLESSAFCELPCSFTPEAAN